MGLQGALIIIINKSTNTVANVGSTLRKESQKAHKEKISLTHTQTVSAHTYTVAKAEDRPRIQHD